LEKCLRVVEGPEQGHSLEEHPFFARTAHGYLYWNVQEDAPPAPEWAVHFLLLYLLGMLSRYEAEIWGDFVCSYSYAELALVEQFFVAHLTRFPQMISALIKATHLKQKNNLQH
jgi:hypothetical protein